ncbi:dethiobiotin synthase [Anaerolentibacter hominis]|uniref:dethiobiotin synthase n=1 Tax=Anaerolentibacter hominis TaxID=3079009 RepID=UPI0031B88866
MSGIFIAGTGTDVGKTYITGQLIKLLRDAGEQAGYYKPVLSGAENRDGRRVPGDAEYVVKTAGLPGKPEDYVSYCLEFAASPHLSARMEQEEIGLEKILEDFREKCKEFDWLTVEGCGGLYCPLWEDDGRELLLTDVIQAMKLPVCLVADAGLGTLNHIMLTAESMAAKGIVLKAVILNRFVKGDPICRENQRWLSNHLRVPVIPCGENGVPQTGADEWKNLYSSWK